MLLNSVPASEGLQILPIWTDKQHCLEFKKQKKDIGGLLCEGYLDSPGLHVHIGKNGWPEDLRSGFVSCVLS